MINIDKSNIMTEECIQNYQNFLKQTMEDASKNRSYALENHEHKNNKELFPSVKLIDRRKEDDPTYQGYYALEMLDRRKNSEAVVKNYKRFEWVKFTARNFFGEELFY